MLQARFRPVGGEERWEGDLEAPAESEAHISEARLWGARFFID
jgi:hypothetical protein